MTSEIVNFLEFDGFRLDLSRNVLWFRGEPIHLAAKEVEILSVLAARAGEVVTKNELLDLIWEDCYVNENNISRHIYLIRKMFREEAGLSRIIQTVPRCGYRFTAEVSRVGADDIWVSRTVVHTKPPPAIRRAVSISVSVLMVVLLAAVIGWQASGSNAASPTVSPISSRETAAELYQKGRAEWRKRDRQSMIKAERFFREAIDRDPNFVDAYVGLADRMMMLHDPTEARNALERALEIDPANGPAHASRGFIRMFHEWDWEAAEADFKKSIAIAPDYGPAHHWYATLLEIRGRDDEARAEFEKAIELDPASFNYLADFGQFQYFAGDLDEAEKLCRRALEIEPEFAFATDSLGEILIEKKMFEEAIVTQFDAYRKANLTGGSKTQVDEYEREAEKKMADFRQHGFDSYLRSLRGSIDSGNPTWFYGYAKVSARLGEREEALRFLEVAVNAKARFSMPFVNREPAFASLRNEPRFREIVRKMGLS